GLVCVDVCVCVCVCVCVRAYTHMQQEVVLEDPLYWLEQVRTQGEAVFEGLLALTQELSHSLIPHTVSQYSHRPESKETHTHIHLSSYSHKHTHIMMLTQQLSPHLR